MHQLSKEMQGLNWLRNLTSSFQTISMVLLSAALHHVYHPDPHQLWNPLFHSCLSLSPPSSNVMDELLDPKSNICLWDDHAYGNGCKTFASSLQHGFHYPMDLCFSVTFSLKVSCMWPFSSNILKHNDNSNHKKNI